jgi:hypothetical protein
MLKYPLQRNRVQRCVMITKVFAAVLLTAFTAFPLDDLGITALPADEIEAARMLENGSLDSSLWDAIREFYTAPLCVPRGECAILQDLFFFLPDDLPVAESSLLAYEPWGRKEQERFFERFPELEPFRPILSFEAHSAGLFPMRTAFYFSRQNVDDTSRQYAVFSLGDKRKIEATGRVDFSDAYGRWRRRALECRPVPSLRITAGNFTTPRRTALFYGYFPEAEAADSSITGSWLHARSRTWNGLQVRFGETRRTTKIGFSGEAVLHDRPTERIALVEGGIMPTKGLSFFGGASGLVTRTASVSERFYYLHAGCSFNFGAGWNGLAYAGMEAGTATISIPWIVEVNNRTARNSFRGSFSSLPAGFSAPRSRLAMMAQEKGFLSDTLHENVIFADLAWSHRLSSFFAITPEVNALFADQNLFYAHPSIGITGSLPLAYRLRYSWVPMEGSGEVEHERHQIVVFASIPAGNRVVFDGTHSSMTGSSGYWRHRSMITPTIKVSRALQLAPVYIVSGKAGDRWEHIAGLKQILSLHEKTFTEFNIERELPFTSWENIRAQARMSFLF